MVKYIFASTCSSLIKFDAESETVDAVPYMRTHIDWAYEAPEDGILDDGTKVKKGDIIILFYKQNWTKHRYVVINNKMWKANRAAEKKYEEEAMLKKEACCPPDEDCAKCCEG